MLDSESPSRKIEIWPVYIIRDPLSEAPDVFNFDASRAIIVFIIIFSYENSTINRTSSTLISRTVLVFAEFRFRSDTVRKTASDIRLGEYNLTTVGQITYAICFLSDDSQSPFYYQFNLMIWRLESFERNPRDLFRPKIMRALNFALTVLRGNHIFLRFNVLDDIRQFVPTGCWSKRPTKIRIWLLYVSTKTDVWLYRRRRRRIDNIRYIVRILSYPSRVLLKRVRGGGFENRKP